MRWLELALRIILILTIFSGLLASDMPNIPIVELALIIIYSSLYYLIATFLERENRLERSEKSSGFSWQHLTACLYFSLFAVTCLYLPYFYFFLAVYFYDVIYVEKWYALFAIATIFLGAYLGWGIYLIGLIHGLAMLAAVLPTLIRQYQSAESESYQTIDQLRYFNQRFKQEQQQLLSMQDERVASSIRQERKRIVGEIHDILGHQISSAVIQVAALQYVVSDEQVKETLLNVQEVLQTSMDNVRTVIHAERVSALDVEAEIRTLVQQFSKAAVKLSYQNQSEIPNVYAHSIVNIVKEALTNINKHSNADQVAISLNDLPQFWTLLIADNGQVETSQTGGKSGGIGLLNIEERVHQMNGSLHLSAAKGFRIFIKIPKP